MKQLVKKLLIDSLSKLAESFPLPNDFPEQVKVERTKDPRHGDFASNIALLLAKYCQKNPRQFAELLVKTMNTDKTIEKIEIAGPGFINFFMHQHALFDIIPEILQQKETFGSSDFGKKEKLLIEFVSANPTGPLHVGHGRGAAFGASLANILAAAGFDVHCEYYVNDAGRQMDILAVSVWLRYLSLANETILFPSNGYRGTYVQSIAQQLIDHSGQRFVYSWQEIGEGLPLDEPQGGDKEIYIDALITRAKKLLTKEGFAHIHQTALNAVLLDIKEDLSEFGVHFDCFFSEASLVQDAIQEGIQALKKAGHTYLKEGALWFKATEFGDEKDRVLVRANGQTTYFASDVAYHWNKFNRGFKRAIDIFGADHHGYTTRITAAVQALGHEAQALTILLVQFAILYRGNERVQMSTRSGSFVTLRELREEVGNDAARFFYVMRKPEQHMDFDLELAKSSSNDNPVYYIQYAHARISSVLRQLQERGLTFDEKQGCAHATRLTAPQELALLNLVNRYPEVIITAATHFEPHQMAYYLRELANALHSYYNAIHLLCDDLALRNARLCLLVAVRYVLKNGLTLLGVSAPDSM